MNTDIKYCEETGKLYKEKNGLRKNIGWEEDGYVYFIDKGKKYRAHRYIWEMKNGEIPKNMVIDHINGNGLDNRFENLRICLKADNNKNRKINKNNTSGYKGVVFYKHARGYVKKNPWRVWIQCDGKIYSKHGFRTAKEAAIHYNEKAIEMFGEYARLNVI